MYMLVDMATGEIILSGSLFECAERQRMMLKDKGEIRIIEERWERHTLAELLSQIQEGSSSRGDMRNITLRKRVTVKL